MVKKLFTYTVMSVLIVSMIPHTVLAEDEKVNIKNNVLITEIQTNGEGSGTTTQEFIELYNASEVPMSLQNWTIIYINSSNKESLLYTFSEPFLFLPHTFMVGKLASSATTYLPEITADFIYQNGTSGLAATAGGIVLKDNLGSIVDAVAWVSAASYIDDVTIAGLSGGKSAQRNCDSTQSVVSTQKPALDFTIAKINPGTITCDPPLEPEEPNEDTTTGPDTTPSGEDTNIPVPDVPQPEQRIRLPIVLNELFIDPTNPLTDSNDEYVELYNPNSVSLDISGYRIKVGSTTKYTHTFEQNTIIGAKSYITVMAKDTTLALSNTGGTAELFNDLAEIIDSSVYDKALPGASWARGANEQWVWTISPTQNAQNIIIAPQSTQPTTATKTKVSTKKTKTTSQVKSTKKTNFSVALPIQINEVYPDPKSPQTDANDEFVELYNPHAYPINITDYTITVGSTKTYKYIFPEGSVIAPGGYMVVDSASTSLSFSNSGADVKLLNNFDKEIDIVSYEKAKQGASYARNENGQWQWTNDVTKGSQNIFTQSLAEQTGTNVAGIVSGTDDVPLAPAPQPLPGWALAVLGVSAVCYAAYEYRFEARNYFYKLRAN